MPPSTDSAATRLASKTHRTSNLLGTSPSLQLSLHDAATVADDYSGAKQAKPHAASAAQTSESLSQGALSFDMSRSTVTHSGLPLLPAAEDAEHASKSSSLGADGVPDLHQSVHSMHSRQSSALSRRKSVTFGGAHALGLSSGSQRQASTAAQSGEEEEAVRSPQASAQQGKADEEEVPASSGSSSHGSRALVRLSSSLSAAVTETMQDRMLAGGLMHRPSENTHADRCLWTRHAMKDEPLVDRCSWPRSAMKNDTIVARHPENTLADRCSWPRHSVKSTSGSVQDDTHADSNAGQGRRSMPAKLARHHSSLNQVSKRPDFAAAMQAVRSSWRAEEIGQLDTGNNLALNNSDMVPDDCAAELEPSSIDAVWASIKQR